MFAVVVLLFFGVSFAAFGIWALAAPAGFASLVQLQPQTPAALTEIRAFYGGLEIGLAAYLIGAAFYRSWRPGALLALVAIAGGIAAGRCVGLVIDQSLSGTMIGALVWECAGAVSGLLAYSKLEHK